MSDCGVYIKIWRDDGAELTHCDLERVRSLALEMRQSAVVTSELGADLLWRVAELHGPQGSVHIILSEFWGEEAELLILGPDGRFAEAPFTTMVIDGEEVEVPEIPSGNPGADEILERLLERDLASLRSCESVVSAKLSPELACLLRADTW